MGHLDWFGFLIVPLGLGVAGWIVWADELLSGQRPELNSVTELPGGADSSMIGCASTDRDQYSTVAPCRPASSPICPSPLPGSSKGVRELRAADGEQPADPMAVDRTGAGYAKGAPR